MRMQEADPLLLRNNQNRTPIGKQVERERTQEKDDSEKGDEGAAEGRRHSGWLMRNNPSVNQLINRDLKNLVARVNRSR